MRAKNLHWMFIIGLILGLSACANTAPQPQEPVPTLVETAWELQDIISPDHFQITHATLKLSKGSVSGLSGCNRYVGGYSTSSKQGHALFFSRFASTRMMCADENAMLTEKWLLQRLGQVTQYDIQGQQLTLSRGNQPLLQFRVMPEAAARTVNYLCEQQAFSVKVSDEIVQFDWQGKAQTLQKAPSASGGKYQNADFTFMMKGNEAYLFLPEQRLHCLETP